MEATVLKNQGKVKKESKNEVHTPRPVFNFNGCSGECINTGLD